MATECLRNSGRTKNVHISALSLFINLFINSGMFECWVVVVDVFWFVAIIRLPADTGVDLVGLLGS